MSYAKTNVFPANLEAIPLKKGFPTPNDPDIKAALKCIRIKLSVNTSF